MFGNSEGIDSQAVKVKDNSNDDGSNLIVQCEIIVIIVRTLLK